MRFASKRVLPDGTLLAYSLSEVLVPTLKTGVILSDHIHGDWLTVYLSERPVAGSVSVTHAGNPVSVVSGSPSGATECGLLVDYGILFFDPAETWGDVTVDYNGVGAVVSWPSITEQHTPYFAHTIAIDPTMEPIPGKRYLDYSDAESFILANKGVNTPIRVDLPAGRFTTAGLCLMTDVYYYGKNTVIDGPVYSTITDPGQTRSILSDCEIRYLVNPDAPAMRAFPLFNCRVVESSGAVVNAGCVILAFSCQIFRGDFTACLFYLVNSITYSSGGVYPVFAANAGYMPMLYSFHSMVSGGELHGGYFQASDIGGVGGTPTYVSGNYVMCNCNLGNASITISDSNFMDLNACYYTGVVTLDGASSLLRTRGGFGAWSCAYSGGAASSQWVDYGERFNPGTSGLSSSYVCDAIRELRGLIPSLSGLWSVSGNSGTDPSTHFFGTTDDVSFVFKRNNRQIAQFHHLNISFGPEALADIDTSLAEDNFAAGYYALNALTSARSNIAIGENTLASLTTSAFNIAIGSGVLNSFNPAVGSNVIGIGYNALSAYNPTLGNTGVVAIGQQAAADIVEGASITAVGAFALQNASSGINNTAVGYAALAGNGSLGASGIGNTAVGFLSSSSYTTADYNCSFGMYSLYSLTTGDRNCAYGEQALYSAVANNKNVAVGDSSLFSLSLLAHSYNTAVGSESLYACQESYNTAVGYRALDDLVSYTNCSGLGFNAQVTGSNQVQLGDASTTVYAYGAVQNRSDARDKTDIRNTALGLDFILSLRPVDYRWDVRDAYRASTEARPDKPVEPHVPVKLHKESADSYKKRMLEYNKQMAKYLKSMEEYVVSCKKRKPLSDTVSDGSKAGKRYHHGFIAQEVKTAVDELGVDFGGYQNHALAGGEDVLSLGYVEFIAPLVAAVQDLHRQIEELKILKK